MPPYNAGVSAQNGSFAGANARLGYADKGQAWPPVPGAGSRGMTGPQGLPGTASYKGLWLPEDDGFKAVTFDPAMTTYTTRLTSGYIFVSRFTIREAMTLVNVHAAILLAGVTLTAGQNKIGLYDASGVLIARTADQAAAWVSTGFKTAALVAEAGQSLTLAPGHYHLAFLAVGTTTPGFAYALGTADIMNGSPLGSINRNAYSSVGSRTDIVAPRPTLTALGSIAIWGGVS